MQSTASWSACWVEEGPRQAVAGCCASKRTAQGARTFAVRVERRLQQRAAASSGTSTRAAAQAIHVMRGVASCLQGQHTTKLSTSQLQAKAMGQVKGGPRPPHLRFVKGLPRALKP